MTNAPDILIFVVPKTLTDGSTVYNVEISELAIEATSKDEAEEIAQTIVDAINEGSNTTAEWLLQ